MESSYTAVKTVTLKIITDKPVKKTPYQVKGVFMRQFPDEEIIPLLDGRYRDQFLYPRVQVKILNEQIYIVGINEGVEPILSLVDKFDFLDFGNITFQVLDTDVDERDDLFRPLTRMIRYRFITPWVALNQTTGIRYRYLNSMEKLNYLSRLLSQNIVFLAREMGMELEEKIFTRLSLTSLFPKTVDETYWGAFNGEFRTNFILPNYLGVGNGITRGYGAIYGLYNPAMFSFDEDSIKGEIGDKEPPDDFDEKMLPENEGIGMDDVPRPHEHRRTSAPHRPPRRPGLKRKVFSEEFEIEEQGPPPPQPPSPPPPPPRRQLRRKPVEETPDDDSRFNTEEYHKKRHEW
ncbi:MAG: CRISPR-associated endonuclease Cas6 [Candidatus Neomarinimicrobiota bacterium]